MSFCLPLVNGHCASQNIEPAPVMNSEPSSPKHNGVHPIAIKQTQMEIKENHVSKPSSVEDVSVNNSFFLFLFKTKFFCFCSRV